MRILGLYCISFVLAVSSAAAQPGTARNEIRVQLTAHQKTVLSSELAGAISSLSVREGDSFTAGQELMALDCDMHIARLNKAKAQEQEAAKVQQVNSQLDKLGSISTLEVDVAVSRAIAASAEAQLMQSIVDRCQLYAPFSGKVSLLEVDAYQYVSEGQPVMEILDDSQLNVEMYVPSHWVGRVNSGQRIQLRIEETGRTYEAIIDRVGASIDAVSQSLKVYARVDGENPELRSGMSGIAIIEP
ncbi:MAG: efflux RND transporter periplasmic adaptor subunit [Pseudohongiellaceae bacterium]|nr:efflux RND transporter periplasmic adaptor subunit [Pseudohongiellaceae bacterium]